MNQSLIFDKCVFFQDGSEIFPHYLLLLPSQLMLDLVLEALFNLLWLELLDLHVEEMGEALDKDLEGLLLDLRGAEDLDNLDLHLEEVGEALDKDLEGLLLDLRGAEDLHLEEVGEVLDKDLEGLLLDLRGADLSLDLLCWLLYPIKAG